MWCPALHPAVKTSSKNSIKSKSLILSNYYNWQRTQATFFYRNPLYAKKKKSTFKSIGNAWFIILIDLKHFCICITCLMIIRPNVLYIFETLFIFHVFTFYWNLNLNGGAIVVCVFIAVCKSLWMLAVHEYWQTYGF